MVGLDKYNVQMNQTTPHRRTRRKSTTELPDARRASTTFTHDMQAHVAEAASLLKVLAHETRLLVLCHLSRGELSVGEINARVTLSQSALSQHLAVLRGEGLVLTRRQGHSIFYRLADTGASQVLAVLHDLYCASAEEQS